jgi:hypothetical protein
VIVHSSRPDIGVAEAFLHFDNVGAGMEHAEAARARAASSHSSISKV